MNDQPPKDEGVALPIVYVGADEVPVLFSNTFIVQIFKEEIILAVAQLTPPMLMGSPEDIQKQAKAVEFVPARILARYGMTIDRARELQTLLGDQIAKYDEARNGTP